VTPTTDSSETPTSNSPEWTRPLPFRVRFLGRPGYLLQFAKLVVWGSPSDVLITRDGRLVTARGVLWKLVCQSTLAQPFASAAILICTPWYFVKQIMTRFALTDEPRDDPFVGFGRGKGSGGLVYWLALVNKSRRFGLFGLVHDNYFGMPLGVHTWPGSTAVLRLIRYRGLVCISAALLSVAIGISAVHGGHPWLALTIPLILCSCYFVFNIYVGVFEPLAWGVAALAVVASRSDLETTAGLLLGATIAIHPGVALLSAAIVSTVYIAHGDWTALTVTGLVGGLSSAWFLLPYLRSRDKLGRGKNINRAFQGMQLRWSRSAIYQALVYSAFLAATATSGAFDTASIIVLALPLAALIVNTKVRWIFSQYTVTNLMLVLGSLYAVESSSPLVWVAYLAVIYTPPPILFGSALGFGKGFDLTPIQFAGAGKRIRETFLALKAGRIAFEHDVFGSDFAYATAALTYLLSDLSIDILNPAYAEIGDSAIYERFVRSLSADSDPVTLERACQSAGVTHLVAFSPALRSTLDVRGLRPTATLSNLDLLPHVGAAPVELTIFEMGPPAEATPAHMKIVPNRASFPAQARREYALLLTAFRGWRAHQNGARVEILDAQPGMRIIAPEDGEMTLTYRYRHYFTP
jgi:hypothetical protein